MSEWQPIETAPKDGTKVILAVTVKKNGNRWVSLGRYFDRTTLEFGKETSRFSGWRTSEAFITMAEEESLLDFTHWMPIPDPPCEGNGRMVHVDRLGPNRTHTDE